MVKGPWVSVSSPSWPHPKAIPVTATAQNHKVYTFQISTPTGSYVPIRPQIYTPIIFIFVFISVMRADIVGIYQ